MCAVLGFCNPPRLARVPRFSTPLSQDHAGVEVTEFVCKATAGVEAASKSEDELAKDQRWRWSGLCLQWLQPPADLKFQSHGHRGTLGLLLTFLVYILLHDGHFKPRVMPTPLRRALWRQVGTGCVASSPEAAAAATTSLSERRAGRSGWTVDYWPFPTFQKE